ncbi:hypothetical protein NS228_23045 [Methylobacterium indicum]|uniref:hypothetical protein n=1 Tax=Methylobacterium indicum TaxID=1775910 RepID=UPI0007346396|nr:hypothetical protein [Methylobacterium indicum]KTS31080.1 hypothetical protein NS228_23045 [Methylobacterium indicum]KTS38089.1 hypothetical protein NS229_04825 [Methylobacterium indicum]KTS51881.1 hypothetical protein NS230_12810 [Methylobacterium indicum]
MHQDAIRPHRDGPGASARGIVLTLLGVVIGSAGYYASWRYQTPLGTIGGIAGLALCVVGTSHGHEGGTPHVG